MWIYRLANELIQSYNIQLLIEMEGEFCHKKKGNFSAAHRRIYEDKKKGSGSNL